MLLKFAILVIVITTVVAQSTRSADHSEDLDPHTALKEFRPTYSVPKKHAWFEKLPQWMGNGKCLPDGVMYRNGCNTCYCIEVGIGACTSWKCT